MHFEIIGIRTEKTLVKVSSPYPFRDIVYSSSLSLPGNAFIHCFCVHLFYLWFIETEYYITGYFC